MRRKGRIIDEEVNDEVQTVDQDVGKLKTTVDKNSKIIQAKRKGKNERKITHIPNHRI